MKQTSSEEILRMFQALNQAEGISIILVTHDPSVAQHARRIIQIHDGRVVEGAGPEAPLTTGSATPRGTA
jgi:ABC-type lipoprotein export system ATPase subunit